MVEVNLSEVSHSYYPAHVLRIFESNKRAKMHSVKCGGKLGFVKVAETSEIAVGKMKMVKVKEKDFLIVNVNGDYYAIGNKCTHAGGDLSKGSLEGSMVTCPKHKARFDVTTGKVVSGPKILFMHPKINDEPSYKVKVEGNDILLETE
jgi:nitrite reductase/ring-hydroxylating ferredoxin subunit